MIGYIYLITNNINGKQYVGKTYSDIEKRFSYHIKDSKRKRTENRPLYKAIKKYGIENFSIELVEQCDKNLEEREIFWISKLETYHKGYNATLGGDGKRYFEYSEKEVVDKYIQLNNLKETSKFFDCDKETIRKILLSNNVEISLPGSVTKKKVSKSLSCYNSENDNIDFDSTRDAARFIIEITNRNPSEKVIKHIAITISRSCNKEHRKAYGFSWKWKENIAE